MINSAPQIQLRDILDIVYPIGVIVEFASYVDPNDIMLGQQWELYGQGKTTVCKDSGIFYFLGDSVGSETHTLREEEMPVHSHTRGNMNISGIVGSVLPQGAPTTGAFSVSTNHSRLNVNTTDPKSIELNTVLMDASESWRGETSREGGGQAHNNIQPSIVVLRYRRIA